MKTLQEFVESAGAEVECVLMKRDDLDMIMEKVDDLELTEEVNERLENPEFVQVDDF